ATTVCTPSCTTSSCLKRSWLLHDQTQKTPRTQRCPWCSFSAGSCMSGMHDDDILGKAYDARLMRRLLQYLRPYWRSVLLAFVAIIIGAGVSLAQPYLMKVAIDRYIATGNLNGLDRLALLYFALLVTSFAAEYVQTW